MSPRELHAKWWDRMGFSFPQSKRSVFYSEIATAGTAGVRGPSAPEVLELLTGAFHNDIETPELPPVNRSSLAQSDANWCCKSGRAPSEQSSSLPGILLPPSANT